MTKLGTARQLELILEGTDAGLVVGQLKAMLAALPPDDGSANDLHLRDVIEAFVAGWELGRMDPKNDV